MGRLVSTMAQRTDSSNGTGTSDVGDCTGESVAGADCTGGSAGARARALTCEHWPRTTPLAERTGPTVHAVFRLSRMHKTISGGLLRDLGLAPGQELLLLQLWDRDHCSQADLVERLGLDPSTVTKMLQRLERNGWVGREPSASDRARHGRHAHAGGARPAKRRDRPVERSSRLRRWKSLSPRRACRVSSGCCARSKAACRRAVGEGGERRAARLGAPAVRRARLTRCASPTVQPRQRDHFRPKRGSSRERKIVVLARRRGQARTAAHGAPRCSRGCSVSPSNASAQARS